MNKKIVIITITILTSIAFLSGCQEETTTDGLPANVLHESDIVELTYANITKTVDAGNTLRVEVQFLFRVVVDRKINYKVKAEFYDDQDVLLYVGSSGPFIGYSKAHNEAEVLEANKISYSGVNASRVSYVRLLTPETDIDGKEI